MSIKLKHSGGNSVSLNPPTSAPTSSDVAFKLPNADGSANQVIKTDGSGNLGFTTPAAALFSSYAIIADQKTAGSYGGTFNNGSWRTRDLNTEIADADGIVTISNNKFTLQAGTYLVKAQAPAYKVNRHMIRMMNETDGSAVAYGTSEYARESDHPQTHSFLITRFTISAAKEFEISHRCETSNDTSGFGIESNSNFTVPNEQYTMVEIYKES